MWVFHNIYLPLPPKPQGLQLWHQILGTLPTIGYHLAFQPRKSPHRQAACPPMRGQAKATGPAQSCPEGASLEGATEWMAEETALPSGCKQRRQLSALKRDWALTEDDLFRIPATSKQCEVWDKLIPLNLFSTKWRQSPRCRCLQGGALLGRCHPAWALWSCLAVPVHLLVLSLVFPAPGQSLLWNDRRQSQVSREAWRAWEGLQVEKGVMFRG